MEPISEQDDHYGDAIERPRLNQDEPLELTDELDARMSDGEALELCEF